jgi:hypothetical protein
LRVAVARFVFERFDTFLFERFPAFAAAIRVLLRVRRPVTPASRRP